MEPTPGFSGFKITNYWKYLLYLSGVVLVLSMFVPAQGVDNEYVRRIAFEITLGGLLIWFVQGITNRIEVFLDRKDVDYHTYVTVLIGIQYIVQIVVWVFIFARYFL